MYVCLYAHYIIHPHFGWFKTPVCHTQYVWIDIPSKLLGLDFQGLDPVNKTDGEITDAWNLSDPDRILNWQTGRCPDRILISSMGHPKI